MTQSAFLFDLNGTMVDDMDYHLQAWYDILVKELGANMTLEEVKAHNYGKSQEILVRIFGEERFSPAERDQISMRKEIAYQDAYKPNLKLIDGLNVFLERSSAANIKMAIGSAAVPFNIHFVLDNLKVGHHFHAIVSADDVHVSKPDPETYLKAALLLGVNPHKCIVFEDVPKGVEAARNAGMRCVVITTTHPKTDFSSFDNIVQFIDGYTLLHPEMLIEGGVANPGATCL
jgi:beta-phosphoglucomutase